uniref:BAR domain-containing protein n=1 Tax=Caenorhabditis japonica TaxID=281687 RepID=A0A8R1DZN3_CAEJA
MFKFNSGSGNRWLNERDGFEGDILAMVADASIVYDSVLELLKSLQSFTKSVGDDEKKHPYMKASRAARTYAAGMQSSSASVIKSAERFEKYYSVCCALKENIGSTVLAKIISFREVECKECDSQMTLLKKTYKDCQNKKNKKNVDTVQLEAAEASLKKLLEEAKGTLTKFTKAGTEMLTQLSVDMKAAFDTYSDSGLAC